MQNPHLQSDFPAHALRKRLRKSFVSKSFGFSNSSFGGLSSTITPFVLNKGAKSGGEITHAVLNGSIVSKPAGWDAFHGLVLAKVFSIFAIFCYSVHCEISFSFVPLHPQKTKENQLFSVITRLRHLNRDKTSKQWQC